MQEENYEHNKSREEYYYLEKKGLCKFFRMLLASFFGTLLALSLFNAFRRPFMPLVPGYFPMFPSYSHGYNMDRAGFNDRMMMQEEFNEQKLRAQKRCKDKRFGKEFGQSWLTPETQDLNRNNQAPVPTNSNE